ncbi:hypothetical protein PR202_gb16673 [Eleusine coracana subsp. coracana]|uniref:CCT domain-containing protein n=1 Tax=Eleusine coracana subsp. coracana TaxID=191504 RepID=A0AAV5F0X2_ELECO|nr:hypothetical protein QOZ80_9BG0695280 [Eleusine coracana subsp. coracana]GJN28534.1 hypothetical protein PR202_gb16673 [Eleusine coracana subsp. coracana]
MDGEVASRPDALLASGGTFLPIIGHHQQQQQEETQLTPGMASFYRVMSTGDLTLIREEEEEPPMVAAPPVRYSAEERRERIDKYRSKRNQRNFQKKITYACRKTLADSRPRVKGRFARGGGDYYADPEAEVVQAAATGVSESESPPVNDVATGGEASESTSMPEWWPAMQEALATGVDLCDEEMLAAYLGVSSISLYSPSYSHSGSS